MTILSNDAQVALQHVRAAMRAQRSDSENARVDRGRFARFYKSRVWRAARYAFLKTSRPSRARSAASAAARRRHMRGSSSTTSWRSRRTGAEGSTRRTSNCFATIATWQKRATIQRTGAPLVREPMRKQSKSRQPPQRVRYSNQQIMEALRSLEAEGRVYSKLCPDGKVRFFATKSAALKTPTGKRQAELMIE